MTPETLEYALQESTNKVMNPKDKTAALQEATNTNMLNTEISEGAGRLMTGEHAANGHGDGLAE